jgi:hypothetical protein
VVVLETTTWNFVHWKQEKFSKKGFIGEFKELIKYKRTFGFTIIAGFVTGSFMVYQAVPSKYFRINIIWRKSFRIFLPDWQSLCMVSSMEYIKWNGKIDYHRPGFIFCGLGDLYCFIL